MGEELNSEALSRRLSQLAEIAGSQRSFAGIVGYTSGSMTNWIQHGVIPYESKLRNIAARTGVSLEWLKHGRGDEETELGNFRRLHASGGPRKRRVAYNLEESSVQETATAGGVEVRKIPVLSFAQAGAIASTAWEDIDDYEGMEVFAVKDRRAVAVRIRGDSMSPDYKPGTIAIVYPTWPVKNGNLVIAKLRDGQVLFKRAFIVDDKYHFTSINPKYETLIVPPTQVEAIFTVGKTERDEV